MNKPYTYEEAYKESLDYFDGDEMAASTFLDKYAMRDEDGNILEPSPSYMHKRMAKEFARIEKNYENPLSEEEIYKELEGFNKIIPQGSIMSILGTDQVASLSNCVVLPEIPDSYGGILYTDQQLAQLFKRRCGVGIDISTLRPEGTSTNNAARTSTGAVSFMERFSNTTREVAQSGRRGALMITMDIRHPDIEKFVEMKQDLEKVTGANISVRITDEFMRAVENDELFKLRYPIDIAVENPNSWHRHHLDELFSPSKEKTVDTIRARNLWNKIVSCAHNTAEPGIIFWDRQDDYSPSSVYPGFENVSTNPCCFLEDSNATVIVLRNKEVNKIKLTDVKKNDLVYYLPDDSFYRTSTGYFRASDNATVFKVKMNEEGQEFFVTKEHKFLCFCDDVTGEILDDQTPSLHGVSKRYVTVGALQEFMNIDETGSPLVSGSIKPTNNIPFNHPLNLSEKRTSIHSIVEWDVGPVGCIEVPETNGFYVEDGDREGGYGVTSGNSEIAMQGNDTCRLTAINLTGFIENPFTHEAYFDYNAFSESVRKAVRLMDDIVDLEIEQIDKILEKVHNDPEDDKYKQVEIDTWEQIRENAVKGRRTGLGITGLGDTLAMLGLDYDSEKGKRIIEEIMDEKMTSEVLQQMTLSDQRGPFPEWDPDKEFNYDGSTFSGKNDFFQFICNRYSTDAVGSLYRRGHRNISWSTVAPTGSLSIMAQVTSGIEPLFAPYYTRRKKINPDDENTRVDYVDQSGDSWQEYPVVHQGIKKFGEEIVQHITEAESPEDKKEVPVNMEYKPHAELVYANSRYLNNTAPEIDWIDRVEVQSIVQKYTTHSISSTINLPKDVSVDKVKEIYMEAWKRGLKGITVYRDGARSGVLITNKEDNDNFKYHDAPDRPKTLEADIYHATSEGQEWIVVVGLLENKPYEVFAYRAPEEGIPPHRSKQYITKDKKGVFVLHNEDRSIEYGNIANAMSEEKAAVTLLASGMLRHGAKIDFVTKSLKKVDANITSFVKAINRTLQRYNIEEENESFEDCPNDGEGCDIVREEGCVLCRVCGHTACS